MHLPKGADLFLSVILPLLIGVSFYWPPCSHHLPSFLRNHLADGLWAFAFTNGLLIIWKRQYQWNWLLTVPVLGALYELGQYYHLIGGTADWKDLVFYIIFYFLALFLNKAYLPQND